MEKAKHLYHGSQYLFDTLKPQQAAGLENENGDKFGIYAYEHFGWVIPFALPIRWYPDNPRGRRSFSCESGIVTVDYGSLNPAGFGYVYKISSENFVKIDEEQWLSETETKPLEVVKIDVSDYWGNIFFSAAAWEIMAELYPMYIKFLAKKGDLYYLCQP